MDFFQFDSSNDALTQCLLLENLSKRADWRGRRDWGRRATTPDKKTFQVVSGIGFVPSTAQPGIYYVIITYLAINRREGTYMWC